MDLTLTTCQKICITLPSGQCTFLPLSWNIANPNLLSIVINGSGNSAVITPIPPNAGSTVVTIFDTSGYFFTIYVTVISQFNTVINPKYQYIYSTNATASFGSPTTTININGPFNSLITPFQPNIVTFVSSSTIPSSVSSSTFIPGSNSIITCRGNFATGSNTLNFVLLKKTNNTITDPILLYTDNATTNPISTTPTGYNLHSFPSPISTTCNIGQYISLVQVASTDTNQGTVFSSQFFTNSTISYVVSGSIQTTISAIVIPRSFYNISSPNLIYVQVFNLTLTASITTLNITIPTITIGSVVWFAQQCVISNNSVQINQFNQTTTTNLQIRLITSEPTPFSTDIAIIAFKNQSNVGFTLT